MSARLSTHVIVVSKDKSSTDAFQGFLAGKFRLEHWWFGLVLLARNLGLSMAIALAVDHASLQRTIVMLIMLGYFGFLALPCDLCDFARGMVTRVSPWKVPMINMADAVVTCALVLLVSLAAQDSAAQKHF